jgi:predicted Zn-dependent protease
VARVHTTWCSRGPQTRRILRDKHRAVFHVPRQLFKLQHAVCAALALTFCVTSISAQARKSEAEPSGPILIRDAEIEGLLRQFSKPIFNAAHIDPDAVKVYVIADDGINAFVAGGQRIFMNTGLFTKTKSYKEVVGVLAHETGHIAGGHLAKMQNEIAQASTERIIGMLVGVAAAVGGSAAGVDSAAGAGQGLIIGSQGLSQRRFLSYQRAMESSADQAAIKFLNATKQDPSGMLTLFSKMANDSLATTANANPYLYSHPMPLERLRNLEDVARKSPYFGTPENAGLKLRYDLVKAKIIGYTQSPQRVFQRYPSSDTSLASRYARSVALYRRGDINNAIPLLDDLTAELPQNPYFWELKAQALLEAGQASRGLPAIVKARELLPNSGLLQILHAQLLLSAGGRSNAAQALKLLILSKKSEGESPVIYKNIAVAHAVLGDVARAELATAEQAFANGDRELAVEKAKAAQTRFKHGSPEWLRATDILTFAARKK